MAHEINGGVTLTKPCVTHGWCAMCSPFCQVVPSLCGATDLSGKNELGFKQK